MYRYKQRMGGCKRLVDKASKALSIFHERRDTVKQYIAGEYRAVHTLREGLERGEVHSSVALWWVLCEDTVWNYITSTHLHFVLKGQTRRTCSENASERWTGLDTHIHIYVCVYIYILQLFVYNSYTHTFIYIYTVTVIQFFVSVSNHQKIKRIQVCEACVPLVLSSEVFSFLEVWEGSYINIHQMSSIVFWNLGPSMNAGTCWTTQTICCLTVAK